MNLKNVTSTKRLAIIISSIIIVIGLLFVSQSYFGYQEVRSLADECYDKGGLPKIEKSGFSVDHFSCNMDN